MGMAVRNLAHTHRPFKARVMDPQARASVCTPGASLGLVLMFRQGNIIMKVARGFFFFKSSLTGASNTPSAALSSLSPTFGRKFLFYYSFTYFFSQVTRYDGSIVGEIEQEFTILRRKSVSLRPDSPATLPYVMHSEQIQPVH
jgi:hypothetical protein